MEEGISQKELLTQMYGSYATVGRIEPFVKESSYVNAYYAQISEEKAPSDEEILAYYEEHKADYDSVDYRQTLIKAELPTEPTELADPVEPEDTKDAANAGDTEPAGEDASAEDAGKKAYQPSEAEIAKAMEDAKALADKAEKTVKTEGELQEGLKYAGITGTIRNWLYNDERKEGDTTVIEDTTGNQYYVLSFEKRYLDETPSVDMRIIMTESGKGQAALDEWKNGGATQESFGVLADQYNKGTSFTAEGGYYEGVTPGGTQEKLAAWLFDGSRLAGETTVISVEEGNDYVLYYVGQNQPEWKLNARGKVLSETMEAYLEEISEGFAVEDPRGRLNYLRVQAQESAGIQENMEALESTQTAESAENDGASESPESDGDTETTAATESAENPETSETP